MTGECTKASTVRQLYWLPCAMHDPLVLPPAFDLACCTISPLNAKNGSPARDAEPGHLQSAGKDFRSPTPSSWLKDDNCGRGDMPKRSETPSGAKWGKRHSKYIARHQARNLLDALAFADEIGLRLNVAVDISWLMFSGTVDDRTRFSRCQQRLSKWTKRQGFALTLIWTREVGKYGSSHTHVLIHVPPWLMETKDLQLAIERALEAEGGPNHEQAIKIQPAYAPRGKLLYNLKGLDPREAKQFGVRASYQGELDGKRVGCTENIGARARKRHLLGK